MSIKLNNITLINVDGRDDEYELYKSLKSLIYSSLEINFKEILFLSPKIKNPTLLSLIEKHNITHHIIPLLTWETYSTFMLKNLYDYINTDYCLTVQWDGFILNPHLWNNEFLNYDYIGAIWHISDLIQCRWIHPEIKQKNKFNLVGNGGFSLRSKKLLYETKHAPFQCVEPEDAYICNNYYDYFISKGIKFGTVDIANKFSRENNRSLPWESVFGFHGEKDFINQI